MNETLTCPLCAYTDYPRRFAIKTASGYSRKKFQCPDCKEHMMRNTLYKKLTPYEWGFWLYSSIMVWNRPHYRFYDRISWEKLKYRVKNMGIANAFWEGFKDAKEASREELNNSVDNAYKSDVIQLKVVPIKRVI